MIHRLSDQADGIRLAQEGGQHAATLQRATPDRRHRTLTVTSGKGGVGKTQLSANLAVALAQAGHSVVLLDADLGLASLDLALGLLPERDLRDVLLGHCDIRDILLDGPCGVRLLPACPGRYEMANLGSRERQALLDAVEEVASSFDVLIVDTGAGIGSNAVDFAAGADEVLLVTTPDPTAMRDAYAMAKILHRRAGRDKVRLVANQVASQAEGLDLHGRIDGIVRTFLSLELDYLGSVPRDDALQRAVASGSPFMVSAPRSPAARAVETLARRLQPEPEPRALC